MVPPPPDPSRKNTIIKFVCAVLIEARGLALAAADMTSRSEVLAHHICLPSFHSVTIFWARFTVYRAAKVICRFLFIPVSAVHREIIAEHTIVLIASEWKRYERPTVNKSIDHKFIS